MDARIVLSMDRKRAEDALRDFFDALGLNETDNSALDLANTPGRLVRMYADELFSSLKPGAEDELAAKMTVFRSTGATSMVFSGPLDFVSTCSHHFLPFVGRGYIAYVPASGNIIGASKLPRVLDHFSRKPQIQELLTSEVNAYVYGLLQPLACITLLVAEHECMSCRGVRKAGAKMVTTHVLPDPSDPAVRPIIDEFYQQLNVVRG